MNFRIASASRNAIANQLRALIDANGGAGTITFYDGSQPVNPNTAISDQRLLAVLTFSSPSFNDASGGIISVNTVPTQNARASGTCTWARICDAAGNAVCDCDVGTTGGTINMNTTTIVQNGPVIVGGFTIDIPGG